MCVFAVGDCSFGGGGGLCLSLLGGGDFGGRGIACGGGGMKGSGVTTGDAVLLGRESEQAARQTSSAGVGR